MSDATENEMHCTLHTTIINADRGKLYIGSGSTKLPKTV
jgi:hypothetical protein